MRSTDHFLDHYLPLHTQALIDETLYNTVQKKHDLLKPFNDFSRFKFKQLEDRAAALATQPVDRMTGYAVPKFDIRDAEVTRMKANKSKKSDKYDMMSSASSKRGAGIGGSALAKRQQTILAPER